MFFLPTNINIANMKLNNVDHLSSVSFSSTIKRNRNVGGKKNQGFGQQMADETLRVFSKTCITDNDLKDSFAQKINR